MVDISYVVEDKRTHVTSMWCEAYTHEMSYNWLDNTEA